MSLFASLRQQKLKQNSNNEENNENPAPKIIIEEDSDNENPKHPSPKESKMIKSPKGKQSNASIFKDLLQKAIKPKKPSTSSKYPKLAEETEEQYNYFLNYKKSEEIYLRNYSISSSLKIKNLLNLTNMNEESGNAVLIGSKITNWAKRLKAWEKKNLVFKEDKIALTIGNIVLTSILFIISILLCLSSSSILGSFGVNGNLFATIFFFLAMFFLVFTTSAIFIFNYSTLRICIFEVLIFSASFCLLAALLALDDNAMRLRAFIGVSLIILVALVGFVFLADMLLRKFISEFFSKLIIGINFILLYIYAVSYFNGISFSGNSLLRYFLVVIIGVNLFFVFIKLNMGMFRYTQKTLEEEIYYFQAQMDDRDFAYTAFSPSGKKVRMILEILSSIIFLSIPIMQALSSMMIIDNFIYPSESAAFSNNSTEFIMNRLLAINLLLIPTICLTIAGYGKMQPENYWKYLSPLGIISSIFIFYINMGRQQKWQFSMKGSVFSQMTTEQYYGCFFGIFISGFVIVCTRSKRFLGALLLLLGHSVTTFPLTIWLFSGYNHTVENFFRILLGIISLSLVLIFLLYVIFHRIKYHKFSKHEGKKGDGRNITHLINFSFFIFSTSILTFIFSLKYKESTFIFSSQERSSFIASYIFIFEIFLLFGPALHIVHHENLTDHIFSNYFLKSLNRKTENYQKVAYYLNRTKFYKRLIFITVFILVPIFSLFIFFYLRNHPTYILAIFGSSGLKILFLNFTFAIFLLFFVKMISLFKLSYRKNTMLLVVFYWLIIPIPYCVGFVCWSSYVGRTGEGTRQYYQSIMIYFGIVLMITTTFVAILMNLYLFRIEFEKKVKFIANLLKVDLSAFYIHSNLEILRTWLQYFYINDDRVIERDVKAGSPLFWWEYSGEDTDCYKKELISKSAFDSLNKQLQKNKKKLAKYLKSKFGAKKRGFLQKLCCVGKKKKASEDIFYEDLNSSEKNIQEILQDIKDDELNKDFKTTVKDQQKRRDRVFRRIAKIIYNKSCLTPLDEYKANIPKAILFNDLNYFFRREFNIDLVRKFGQEVEIDPDVMVKKYFDVRIHPYYNVLRADANERNFFLLALFQAFASRTTIPDLETPISMSYFDFKKMADKISLYSHVCNDGSKVGIRFKEKDVKKKFLDYSDVKRVFVSSKFAHGSLEEIVRKAFVPGIGMSFEAFKRLLGNLSSVKFLDEDRDLKEPLSRFTAFLYELSVVHLKDFNTIIMQHDFDQDLTLKPGKSKKSKKKNYREKFKVSRYEYRRSKELEKKLLADLDMLEEQDMEHNRLLEIEESINTEREETQEIQEEIEKKKEDVKLENNFDLFIQKEVNREEDLKHDLLYVEDEAHGLEIKDEELQKKVNANLKRQETKRIVKVNEKILNDDDDEKKKIKTIKVAPKMKGLNLFEKNEKKKVDKTEKSEKKMDKLAKLQRLEDKLIKKKLKEKKRMGKKDEKEHCCIRFENCISGCCRGIKNCFGCVLKLVMEGYEFLTEKLAEKIMNKFKEEELTKMRQDNLEKKRPKDWDEVSQMLIEKTRKYEKDYDSKMASLKIMMNGVNLLTIVSSVIGILMSYFEAFSNFKWFDDNNLEKNLSSNESDGELRFWETWTFRFYFTTVVSGLNLILILAAYGYIKRGTLGINPKTGDKATFPDIQYFTSKLIILLGNTLFNLTISNFSKLFACDFNGNDPKSWKVVLREDFVCFEGDHFIYSSISGVLLITYYLSATTLFPSFQFDEPSLDIKFTANFVILKTQAQVLIDFVEVLLSDSANAYFMAVLGKSLSTGVTIYILYYILRYQPCIVKAYNKAEAVFTSLQLIPILCTLLMLILKNSLIPFSILVVSTLVLVCLSLAFIIKSTSKQRVESKRKADMMKEKKKYVSMAQSDNEKKPLKSEDRKKDEEEEEKEKDDEEKKKKEEEDEEKKRKEQKKKAEKLLAALFGAK